MTDYDKLLQVPRGTKARLEEIKLDLLANTIVYATDTKELGIKLTNGNIEYFMNATDINAKVDTLETANAYFIYAASVYGDKYSLLANAWEHSLTVDASNVSYIQYPNGETEGIIIPHGATSIENQAFSGRSSNDQPLVIPNSVTSIDDMAFRNWEANNQPLIIPNSVTSIGDSAFGNWSSNNQPLIIPNSVTSIGVATFGNWYSNNHPLIIPNSVTSIGERAFRYWSSNNHPIIIPNSVTTIGFEAFVGWSLVPYIEIQATIPPTLASRDAFSLQNDAPIYVPDESVAAYKTATDWVDLADRIFSINDKPDLMDDIAYLQENKQDKLVAGYNITIDENTNVISASGGGGDGIDLHMLVYMNYAADIYYKGGKQSLFANAWLHSLTVDPSEISKSKYPNGETEGVIIPNNVTTIVIGAFAYWEANNQLLVIPSSVTSIGKGAFAYWEANNQPLVIPNSVTSIGQEAFRNWDENNQPLTISNSITSIETETFGNWNANNQPLVIPNSVTSIGQEAFRNWDANNHPLIIPSSVTNIGNQAFVGWSLVPYVEIQAITPPTLASSYAFYEQGNAPIYVPDESVDDYKTATEWVSLADRIFPISDKPNDIDDILALETENIIKSITRSGSNLFTITYYDDTTSSLLTLAELKTFIGEATQSLSGLMSAQDKVDLDTLIALFDEDGDSVVNTIAEILAIFENYPEGADLVTALAGKVDKVAGKGLSTNDFTNNDKNKLDGIEAGAEVNPYSKTQLDNMLDDKVDKVTGKGLSTNDFTTTEKNKLAGIASGAEVNVQSDWDATSGGALILNKPSIPTKVSDLTNDTGYITGYTETDPIFTAWNKSTGINITKSQVSDLIEATQALSGLMSATDKQRLDVLHALLEEDEENSVVDSINEVLAIFNNYPEGADLVSALAGKVDKVSGKGLSTNDLTNALKTNYDNAYTHSQSTHAPSNAQKNSDITKAEIEAKLTGEITSHSHALPTHTHTKSQITDFPTSMPPTAHNHDDRYYTETEVDTKLVGKANATHNHDTDYYKKSEIDLMLGDIESALDAILGV